MPNIGTDFPDPTTSWGARWNYDKYFQGSHLCVVKYRITKPIRRHKARIWRREYEARLLAEKHAVAQLIEDTINDDANLIGGTDLGSSNA
jgi:hypothetical protein